MFQTSIEIATVIRSLDTIRHTTVVEQQPTYLRKMAQRIALLMLQ